MSERDHAMIVQDSSVSLIADFILVLFFVAVTHLSVLMCARACLYSIELDEAETPGAQTLIDPPPPLGPMCPPCSPVTGQNIVTIIWQGRHVR